MAVLLSRTRNRTVPLSTAQTITLGTFYRRSAQSGGWGPWIANGVGGINFRPKMEVNPRHNFMSYEMVSDENHGSPPYEQGGPFLVLKVGSTTMPENTVHGHVDLISADGTERYAGGFYPCISAQFDTMPGFVTPSTPTGTKLSKFPSVASDASKAWNKAKPKIQKVDGFTFFKEGDDIPRMLKTTARVFSDSWKALGGNVRDTVMNPRNVADHFLNTQFGWVPFLHDVRDFHDTFVNNDKYVRDLSDRNGRSERRRVSLGEVTTDRELQSGFGELFTPLTLFPRYGSGSASPTWSLRETVTKKTWAVGKFRFYLQEFDMGNPDYMSAFNRVRRQMDLYGLRICPTNLYNSIPWTWAIDWVSNARDYVDRANDWLVDSLTAEYFYVMTHTVTTWTYTNVLPFVSGGVTLTCSRTTETKQRVEASSPYGIDVSWDSLSPRQLAILAALKITH